MKEIKYEMEMVSSLILSPRSGRALYRDIDTFSRLPEVEAAEFDRTAEETREVKVVYPFYQYGEYKKYDPDNTEYYIPGSSVKGALQRGERKGVFRSDDIDVPSSCIVLRNLFKAQYLQEKGKAKFAPFFDNVGVEMVKSGTIIEGTLCLDKGVEFSEILSFANQDTKIKMEQMHTYLEQLLEEYEKEDFRRYIVEIDKKLLFLSKQDDVILLGGYKGLLHSIVLDRNKKESFGGVFVDYQTKLPHGIVKIKRVTQNGERV